jgi:hypothetical protein
MKHSLPLSLKKLPLTKVLPIPKELSPELKARLEIARSEQKRYRERYDLIIISAATLVAGLFWQDALKSAFELFLPNEQGVIGKFIAAGLVTAIATYLILHIEDKDKKEKS